MSINKISPLFFFALVVSYVRVWPAPSSAKPQLDVTTRPWYHYIKEETPETKIPQINHFKLSNGIGVYFYPADAVPLVTAQIFIDGGGFEVADDKLGLQTLWGDTVVFSGSETMGRDTLSSYLEERASKFNFNAELDRSSFNVQSLAHYFEKDLRTLFSVIENPRFENNDFELLRTRLVKSLEKRDEDPSKWAALGLSQVYWKNTLRGRYATIRTVKNIAREDLTLWQKKLWRAERLTIAVSGSIDEKRLKTLLEETFGKMPYDKTQKADLSRLHVEPTFKPNSLYVLPKEIPQTTVLYKAPGIKHSAADYYALRLFDFLLGGDSFNSQLTQTIRTEKGWAYTAYSTFETDDFTGSVLLFTQTANANLPDVVAAMDAILAHPESFITTDKIERAKISLKNKFVFLFESPAQYLKLYLNLKWDGLPETYLAHYIENLSRVTYADILRVAKKYYQPQNFTLLICGPKEAYQKKSALRPSEPKILTLEK